MNINQLKKSKFKGREKMESFQIIKLRNFIIQDYIVENEQRWTPHLTRMPGAGFP